MTPHPVIAAMRGITKRFGVLVANAEVDFDLRHKEVHALLGENGAGKTTLMNILYGLMSPDAGRIFVEDVPVRIRSPSDAIALGIGMVQQHFTLIPTLKVVENVALGQEPRGLRAVNLAQVAKHIELLARRYGLSVRTEAPVGELSLGEQQKVSILRALFRNPQILILDEPTSALIPSERNVLLAALRALVDDGHSIIIISHHLDEMVTFADRITVLRKGKHVATLKAKGASLAELAHLMVGSEVAYELTSAIGTEQRSTSSEVSKAAMRRSASTRPEFADPVLRVSDLKMRAHSKNPELGSMSFVVNAGEIVVIAGVDGNGQKELEEALICLRPPEAGRIYLDGKDIRDIGPGLLARNGVGYIPSDRYRHGTVGPLSVAGNLVLDRLSDAPFGTRFRINQKQIAAHADLLIRRFSIGVSSQRLPVSTLSGGNAQRVIVARALSKNLRLLIAAHPTRGLDLKATRFVWELLRKERELGTAILVVSADLEEVLVLADRCYVIYEGHFIVHLHRSELKREVLAVTMGGVSVGADIIGQAL